MAAQVVVLGSGYAGTGAVKRLERDASGEVDLTWVSDVDHHFLLHESHRCVRDPAVRKKITFPVEHIRAPATRFRQGRAVDVDRQARTVELADGSTVDYDYLLVAIGSRTAFFGIDGLREHAHTLKSRGDALAIHEAVKEAARAASRSDPARVVVGGAGLSGIQAAGEIAAFRERHRAPLDVHLVEGLDNVYPNNDPVVQARLQKLLEAREVTITTGAFVNRVDDRRVYADGDTELAYDVLLWTGGIAGREWTERIGVDCDPRSNRINTDMTFQTGDPRVFAIGDAALVEQPGDTPAPPTAQAAWQAAGVAGENVARAARGQPLRQWTYRDRGTVISVGDAALVHDIEYVPVDSFGGKPAETLKKAIAARWINRVAGPVAAARAWPDM